jgi:hypothetical protein
MPLDVPPPRQTRFGSPLVVSRVHWVQPALVVEGGCVRWTYEGLREDQAAREVRQSS